MSFYNTHKPPTSGGIYLKLADKEKVKIRLASEPYVFLNDYNGTKSTRYAWIVVNRNENDKVQLLQLSSTSYLTVANLANDSDYGDPQKYDLSITRDGSGTDTKYTILPSANHTPLSAEKAAEVAKFNIKDYIPNALSGEEFESGAKFIETINDDLPPVENYIEDLG